MLLGKSLIPWNFWHSLWKQVGNGTKLLNGRERRKKKIQSLFSKGLDFCEKNCNQIIVDFLWITSMWRRYLLLFDLILALWKHFIRLHVLTHEVLWLYQHFSHIHQHACALSHTHTLSKTSFLTWTSINFGPKVQDGSVIYSSTACFDEIKTPHKNINNSTYIKAHKLPLFHDKSLWLKFTL